MFETPLIFDLFEQLLLSRRLKNVMSAGQTEQNPPKRRLLWAINEHFEEDFNTLRPSAIVFLQSVKVSGEIKKGLKSTAQKSARR